MYVAIIVALVIFFILKSQSRTEAVSKKSGEGVAKVVTTSIIAKDKAIEEGKALGTSSKAGVSAFKEAYLESRGKKSA